MIELRILAAAAALILSAGPARACLGPEFESYAFTLTMPSRDADTMVVRLRIERVRGPTAEGVLIEPFERIAGADRVIVTTDLGSSCARWGIMNGEAYAVGTAPRIENGILYFHALQRHDPLGPPRRKRSTKELDAYITDPAYRSAAQ